MLQYAKTNVPKGYEANRMKGLRVHPHMMGLLLVMILPMILSGRLVITSFERECKTDLR